MKFWDEHEAQRDKFAIVAVHNPDERAKDFVELDKRLEEKGLIKKWGRNLPFTVILDNSKTSTGNYGVQAYPTTILIDPEGKVVKGGGEKMLAEKLKELKDGTKGADAPEKPAETPEKKGDKAES